MQLNIIQQSMYSHQGNYAQEPKGEMKRIEWEKKHC